MLPLYSASWLFNSENRRLLCHLCEKLLAKHSRPPYFGTDSSSKILAQRDASHEPKEGYIIFFNLFDLNVNNNCHNACDDSDIGERKRKERYLNNEIINPSTTISINDESLKAVYIPNINFFKRYNNLRGMTVMIGGKEERESLRLEYDVDCFELPRFKKYPFKHAKSKEIV
ncbi:unnamed protein product [Didymodactylos carnosus]|uniref:Uncharacterized protein n=1 Tax=Didymodactylos carnosus TaxID=1234261 RepID=A0A814N1R6_9BILA|nr:unnamed protein product [Didymodactylos carnosus]CAF1085542.1 unnamed protein product [Didymodactylos carnosus]CAF3560715.1 unnamed protein product [Didymodactylos carnosus]CAF3851135.1 unnamed protein product [Didymodactylos carnosus]